MVEFCEILGWSLLGVVILVGLRVLLLDLRDAKRKKKANQVDLQGKTAEIENEIRIAIKELEIKYFTAEYSQTWIYANEVNNFANDVRNKVMSIVESSLSA